MPASVSFRKSSSYPRPDSIPRSTRSTSELNQTHPCWRSFFGGIKTATLMSHRTRIYYVNQSLVRSWLGSSPAGVEPKPFSTFKTTRPSDRTHSQLHQLKRKL